MRRLAPLVALLLVACVQMDMGMTTTPRPVKKQPPVPRVFEGEAAPAREPTGRPGLERAPELGPNVYFHPPHGRMKPPRQPSTWRPMPCSTARSESAAMGSTVP